LLKAIASADIACLRIAGADSARVTTVAKSLLPLAQDRGVAVLLDDADLAAKMGADGVHLVDASRYRDARRMVGNDGIVGVSCPLERHDAMNVGDDGADYVLFSFTRDNTDAGLELIAWWSEMMTVPCVAAGDITPAVAAQIVAAGADFLAPSASIWSEEDPLATIAGLLSNAPVHRRQPRA
jgi:thiamine-phosphate pyrophosphorylase